MNEQLLLAGRGRRLTATVIDMLLVPSLTIFLVMVAGVVEDAEDYRDRWWILFVFLIAVASYLLLNGYPLWRSGQTLGKKIMGIAMVSAAVTDDGRYTPTPATLWKLIGIRALFFPLLFVTIVICGIYIASNARDRFGFLLATGLTFLIGLQAFINIGVVSGALPNKGLALPFVSYGGSSLVMMLAAIGLLLNVARHGEVAVRVGGRRINPFNPANIPSTQLP